MADFQDAIDRAGLIADNRERYEFVRDSVIPMLLDASPIDRERMITEMAGLSVGMSKTAIREELARRKPQKKAVEGVPTDCDLTPGCYYAMGGRTIHAVGRGSSVHPQVLANFVATITEEVIHDDGEECTRTYTIVGEMPEGRRLPPIAVPAKKFSGMEWVSEWGSGPSIAAGPGGRDHVRAAIQSLSGEVVKRHRYRHTGWRQVGDQWVYLHAGGAIGAEGTVPGIDVDLQGAFRRYVLPDPPEGDDLVAAVRAHLQFLAVAPLQVTAPVFCSVFRAPLGPVDFSLFLVGNTGQGKSEIAALAQQAYGPEMRNGEFPGNWSSTANSLESSAFAPKDALFVIDDFAPTGSKTDQDRYVRDADRFFRAVGNRSGRGRLNADGTPKATKYPRCLPIITGEDLPGGLASMIARLMPVPVPSGCCGVGFLPPRPAPRLDAAQKDAAEGLYAASMAGYVRWLASRYSEVHDGLQAQRNELAASWRVVTGHARTPRLIADLACGLHWFLRYALEVGAVDEERRAKLWDDCTAALAACAEGQAGEIVGRDPEKRFLELLSAALASGRCHVADLNGKAPKDPGAWGWRMRDINGSFNREELVPQGKRIGWKDGGNLFLLPDVSFGVAQELGREANESIAVSVRTLGKRLVEAKMLVMTDEGRGTNTVRQVAEGARRNVLHVSAWLLAEWKGFGTDGVSTEQTDHEGNE